MVMKLPKTQNEGVVKRKVKRILDNHGWFYWMPPANGFGQTGISDIHAVWNSIFMVIETKFGTNKVTPLQVAFLNSVRASGHFAFVVDENNLLWLDGFLQDLAAETREASFGRKLNPEAQRRMLRAIAELTKRIPTTKVELPSSLKPRGYETILRATEVEMEAAEEAERRVEHGED